MDLAGLLNPLTLNTLIFPLIDLYQEVVRWTYLLNLRSPRKELINIKNKDQKCFLWYHVRHINPSKEHPERIRKINKKLVKHITNAEEITEGDKEFINNIDYDGIEFPCKKKSLARLRWKTIYALTCLVMKMSWFFQFMFQIKNLKTLWICCF